jgi:hypothetical protein
LKESAGLDRHASAATTGCFMSGLRSAFALFGCLAAISCGGSSSSSPTGPSSTTTSPPAAPGATVSVTVSLQDGMFVGAQQTATATARLADGRTATASGEWSSDNVQVARVTADGRVTGVASGDTVIRFTTTDGARASASVHVRPDMRGLWQGSFIVRSCEEQGVLADVKVCQIYPVNSRWYIGAVLEQTGASLTGFVDLIDDHRSDDIRYEIPADGALRLDLTAADLPFRFRMQWEAGTRTPGQIDGDLKLLIRVDGFIGEVTLKTNFVEFRRVGSGTRAPT